MRICTAQVPLPVSFYFFSVRQHRLHFLLRNRREVTKFLQPIMENPDFYNHKEKSSDQATLVVELKKGQCVRRKSLKLLAHLSI